MEASEEASVWGVEIGLVWRYGSKEGIHRRHGVFQVKWECLLFILICAMGWSVFCHWK